MEWIFFYRRGKQYTRRKKKQTKTINEWMSKQIQLIFFSLIRFFPTNVCRTFNCTSTCCCLHSYIIVCFRQSICMSHHFTRNDKRQKKRFVGTTAKEKKWTKNHIKRNSQSDPNSFNWKTNFRFRFTSYDVCCRVWGMYTCIPIVRLAKTQFGSIWNSSRFANSCIFVSLCLWEYFHFFIFSLLLYFMNNISFAWMCVYVCVLGARAIAR